MDETIKDQVLDCLICILEFYHKTLFKVERDAITGVREAQLRLLLHLCTGSMSSMSALGELLYISKPYMTPLIDGLIAEGLVKRHLDPKDRRVIKISITKGDGTVEIDKITDSRTDSKHILQPL